jgi:hypothetical protein
MELSGDRAGEVAPIPIGVPRQGVSISPSLDGSISIAGPFAIIAGVRETICVNAWPLIVKDW